TPAAIALHRRRVRRLTHRQRHLVARFHVTARRAGHPHRAAGLGRVHDVVLRDRAGPGPNSSHVIHPDAARTAPTRRLPRHIPARPRRPPRPTPSPYATLFRSTPAAIALHRRRVRRLTHRQRHLVARFHVTARRAGHPHRAAGLGRVHDVVL